MEEAKEGAAVTTLAHHQKAEEKGLPMEMEMSPLKDLFPGPLPQLGSCLRQGEDKNHGGSPAPLEAGPPLILVCPGLDSPVVTTAGLSSLIAHCPSVKRKGLVPGGREVSGCSWCCTHCSTGALVQAGTVGTDEVGM